MLPLLVGLILLLEAALFGPVAPKVRHTLAIIVTRINSLCLNEAHKRHDPHATQISVGLWPACRIGPGHQSS